MSKIIAIVGMCGSGKSIATDYYENLGFKKVYFGGVTLEKMKECGLEINEKNERYMRELLRSKYGMGAYATILLPKIEEYSKNGNVILDGLYSWDEYKILKDKFGNKLCVLAIVVDKACRYDRLSTRSIRSLNTEEAIGRDISEIENLSKGGPIAFADYYILNNESLDMYYSNLDDITKKIFNDER